MNDRHELLSISDVNILDLHAERIGYKTIKTSYTNPLGKKAVFKCKDWTISEVFGYLLAQLLAVPVADFMGLRFNKGLTMNGGYSEPYNQIAILIEYFINSEAVSLEELASREKNLTARILTLYFFDRFEWPEILISDGLIKLIDLERIGPTMCLDECTCDACSSKRIRDELIANQNEYVDASFSSLKQVIERAKQIQVFEEFKGEIEKQGQISAERLCHGLTISGHPCSQLLSTFFQSTISKRQAICTKMIGARSWPVADWESLIISK